MHLFNAAKFNSFWQKILSYLNVFWMLIGGSTKKLLNQVCKGDRKPSGDFFTLRTCVRVLCSALESTSKKLKHIPKSTQMRVEKDANKHIKKPGLKKRGS